MAQTRQPRADKSDFAFKENIQAIPQADYYAEKLGEILEGNHSAPTVLAALEAIPPFVRPLASAAFDSNQASSPLATYLDEVWIDRRANEKYYDSQGRPIFTIDQPQKRGLAPSLPRQENSLCIDWFKKLRATDREKNPGESDNGWSTRMADKDLVIEYDSVDGVDVENGHQKAGKSEIVVRFGDADVLERWAGDWENAARLNGIEAALKANQKAKGLANAAKKQVGGSPARFR